MSKKISIGIAGAAFFALTLLMFSAGMSYAESMKTPEVKAQKTLDNLMAAFNGESNAHARYLAFAKKADQEGYGQAASLFRAAASAEKIHFRRHAKVIKELGASPKATIEKPVVKSTLENVEAAFRGETYEKDVMYPQFIEQAKQDKIEGAIDAFEDAGAAEAVHAALYKKVLDNLEAWKGKSKNFYVCPVCGNVVETLPAAKCPICNTDVKRFKLVK